MDTFQTYQHGRKRSDMRSLTQPNSLFVGTVHRRHHDSFTVLWMVFQLSRRFFPLWIQLLTKRTPRRVIIHQYKFVFLHEIIKCLCGERHRVMDTSFGFALDAAPTGNILAFITLKHDFIQSCDRILLFT